MKHIVYLFLITNIFLSVCLGGQVLALVDKEDHLEPIYNNSIAYNLEVIFNYWGLDLTYHFLDQDLPDDKEMQKYVAVLTYFHNERVPEPEKLLNWLISQSRQKKKLFIWGDIPRVSHDGTQRVSEIRVAELYDIFGIQAGTDDPESPLRLVIREDVDASLVNFERDISKDRFSVEHLVSQEGAEADFQMMYGVNQDDSAWETVIASWGTQGSYIQSDFSLFRRWIGGRGSSQLYLDLFRIVGEVFDLYHAPVPDLTTLMGRRVLMCHIDGDGVNNLSYDRSPLLCGHVIKEEVLEQYPQVLFGVSFIVDTISTGWDGTTELSDLAREIFLLENVEPASHTFHHPLDWRNEIYYEEAEVTFDSYREVVESIEYLNHYYAPEDKPVHILYWSGNCLPAENDIAHLYEKGYYNLNGGRNVTDPLFPSVTQLSPKGRKIGPYRQIFAPMNNEMLYTNLWSGPFWGYKQLIRCLKVADGRYRLKPINLYFHFYSAECHDALNALTHNIEWAVSQAPISIYPVHYCQKVAEFFRLEIEGLGNNSYHVQGLQTIQSLRVESGLIPNLDDKRILGFSQENGKTWIHLQPDAGELDIQLANEQPSVPYLVDANIYSIHCTDRNKEMLELLVSAPLDSFESQMIFRVPSARKWEIYIDGKKAENISSLSEDRISWKGLLHRKESTVLLQLK